MKTSLSELEPCNSIISFDKSSIVSEEVRLLTVELIDDTVHTFVAVLHFSWAINPQSITRIFSFF
mgnify:CR=1 FL=1